MNITLKNSVSRSGKWLFAAFLMMILIFISNVGYAQIDSRNQIRPDIEKKFEDPDKKSKKIKSKKNPRFSGKKPYSNKKQLKRNRRARAKKVEKSPKGDITGRKFTTKRTPRRTIARPQPDPYKNRRIRTERSRAGAPVAKPRTATKKGEFARTGDISGQKRVRQKSRKTERVSRYPQPNPYVGRKIKTEKSRAKSNKSEIRSIRSATRPSESRKPRTQGRPISATAAPKVKTKRHVYRNHERRGGERSTNKDIAGRKLRTKNTRSSGQDAGLRIYSNVSPYTGRTQYKEGGRFKSSKRPAAPRSATRPSESGAYRKSDKYGQRRNSRSVTFTGVKKAKKVRSLSQPSRKGVKPIYGRKYNAGSVRSVSGYTSAKTRRSTGPPVSISGRRKQYKQRNTYQGKDRHFGENSTTKDIAGRRLRTRNYRSIKPNNATSGFMPYYGRTAPPQGKQKRGTKGRGRSQRAGWNNNGSPIVGKGINANSEAISGYRGKMRSSGTSKYGRAYEGVYSGNIKAKSIRKYSGGQESLFSGRKKAQPKPRGGGGSITKRWNNNGSPIIGRGVNANNEAISGYRGKMRASGVRGYAKGREGVYAGRMKAQPKPQGGGGSITRHWNNSGSPIIGKGINANSEALSSYKGMAKARRPLKGGGGSITRHWNNKEQPLVGKGRSVNNENAANYQGKMPLNAMPSYGKGREGVYAGNMKARKPFKGAGGSITRHWNNKEEPLAGRGRNNSNETMSAYQGKGKLKKPLKGGGGTITRHWNNKGEPLEGRGQNGIDEDMSAYQGKMKALDKPEQSEGTERGRTNSLSFIRLGDPTQMGLLREAKNKKVNNSLPKEFSRKEKQRLISADGLDNGKSRTFTFWAFGNPSQGGLRRNPSQAKGRLHPSASYTSSVKSRNSIEEKEQPVKLKIWWAKLFKKNSNQPDSVKEKPKRPRYDKEERSIWETAERPDWYNN